MELAELLAARRSCREFGDRPVPLDMLQRLLWAAQGVTDDSGKRTAPSAHALYPLTLLVVAGRVEALKPGIYGVEPCSLELTLRAEGDCRQALEAAALEDQAWIAQAAVTVVICADFEAPAKAFAEQPPVGERGARYVYLEAGAAAQNVHLQAVADGLGCVPVAGFDDRQTAKALNLAAPIVPVMHLCVGWPADHNR